MAYEGRVTVRTSTRGIVAVTLALLDDDGLAVERDQSSIAAGSIETRHLNRFPDRQILGRHTGRQPEHPNCTRHRCEQIQTVSYVPPLSSASKRRGTGSGRAWGSALK